MLGIFHNCRYYFLFRLNHIWNLTTIIFPFQFDGVHNKHYSHDASYQAETNYPPASTYNSSAYNSHLADARKYDFRSHAELDNWNDDLRMGSLSVTSPMSASLPASSFLDSGYNTMKPTSNLSPVEPARTREHKFSVDNMGAYTRNSYLDSSIGGESLDLRLHDVNNFSYSPKLLKSPKNLGYDPPQSYVKSPPATLQSEPPPVFNFNAISPEKHKEASNLKTIQGPPVPTMTAPTMTAPGSQKRDIQTTQNQSPSVTLSQSQSVTLSQSQSITLPSAPQVKLPYPPNRPVPTPRSTVPSKQPDPPIKKPEVKPAVAPKPLPPPKPAVAPKPAQRPNPNYQKEFENQTRYDTQQQYSSQTPVYNRNISYNSLQSNSQSSKHPSESTVYNSLPLSTSHNNNVYNSLPPNLPLRSNNSNSSIYNTASHGPFPQPTHSSVYNSSQPINTSAQYNNNSLSYSTPQSNVMPQYNSSSSSYSKPQSTMLTQHNYNYNSSYSSPLSSVLPQYSNSSTTPNKAGSNPYTNTSSAYSNFPVNMLPQDGRRRIDSNASGVSLNSNPRSPDIDNKLRWNLPTNAAPTFI